MATLILEEEGVNCGKDALSLWADSHVSHSTKRNRRTNEGNIEIRKLCNYSAGIQKLQF